MSSVVVVSDSPPELSDHSHRVEAVGEGTDKRLSSSHNLCVRCRLIDFEYTGFHYSPDYSGSYYSVRREYPSVSASTGACAFCHLVVVVLHNWIADNCRACEFDAVHANVEIGLETDWHSGAGSGNEAHSVRVRTTWKIARQDLNKHSWRTESLTFFFHRIYGSFHQEPNIPLLLATAPELQPLHPYAARWRPLEADFRLFRRWKELCQRYHGAKCSQIFKGTPRIRPRVIDVHKRCLTTAKEGDDWVCISYVWGRTDALRLTKAKVDSFAAPGSLTPEILPKIAEDALQVTKGIGEKYLWLDSLCIVQDDPTDKAKFISQMDSIYALASVVLIAATCLSARSSIPGASPDSRHQLQTPFTVKGVTLVQSLDPVTGVKPDLRTGYTSSYLGATEWETRAWTLQERFLAARSIVFTAEQVFWECEEAFWCEDSVREFPSIKADFRRSSLCGGELHTSWSDDIPTLDHFYRTVLKDYSGRSLSFQSDALNAFSGIIRAFERSAGHSFIWGMPSGFLESTMAWGSQTHSLRRRIGNNLTVGAMKEDHWLPSWSWAGWTCGPHGKLHNQNLTTEALGIQFYHYADGKHLRQLEQVAGCNPGVDLVAKGSQIPGRQQRPSRVSTEDVPKDLDVSLPALLFFWTAVVTLTVKLQPGASEGEESGQWELYLSRDGHDIQASWFQVPDLPSPAHAKQGIDMEAIAVAQNRGEHDGGHIANGAIGIMFIDRDAGIAFWRGFAWIAIRDWIALESRRWRLIILG